MAESSREGVQLLRALALAVRSEQDFDLITESMAVVGVLKKEGAVPSDVIQVKQRGGWAKMLTEDGYTPLSLRQALNKIAHADPRSADYYIGPGDQAHDLLLYGEDRGRAWFAAVSLLELVKAVRVLPDASIAGPEVGS